MRIKAAWYDELRLDGLDGLFWQVVYAALIGMLLAALYVFLWR